MKMPNEIPIKIANTNSAPMYSFSSLSFLDKARILAPAVKTPNSKNRTIKAINAEQNDKIPYSNGPKKRVLTTFMATFSPSTIIWEAYNVNDCFAVFVFSVSLK